jgi:phenylalanyl-tRNA synthetase alpha subunit
VGRLIISNFSAVNIPADHPARDMQDTFFPRGTGVGLFYRTHTSFCSDESDEGLQSWRAEAILSPGAVYRWCSDCDALSHCFTSSKCSLELIVGSK